MGIRHQQINKECPKIEKKKSGSNISILFREVERNKTIRRGEMCCLDQGKWEKQGMIFCRKPHTAF